MAPRARSALLALAAALLATSPALAQQAALLDEVRSAALLKELLGLLVTATVLESALTTIFQWRLYREFFNGRAVKTLVMIAAGYLVVASFDYDVFARIMAQAGGAGDSSAASQVLSALVLAGGSAAVYQLLTALGFRSPLPPPQALAKPDQGNAWISVKIVRKAAVGDIRIHIQEMPAADAGTTPPLAGVINARPFRERLRVVFFADSMRHPPYGGVTVRVDAAYRVLATGHRAGAAAGDPLQPFEQDIFKGCFAGRAVIDFVQEI